MILFPYAAIPSGHPYSETGPIFVHANECQRYSATNEYPADFRNGRVFRAYDSNYNIIDAQIVNGSEPEVVIESLFQNPDTAVCGCTQRYPRLLYVPSSTRMKAREASLMNVATALWSPCLMSLRKTPRHSAAATEFAARISSMHQPL